MKSLFSVLFGALLLATCILALQLPSQKAYAQEELIPNEFIFQVLLPPRWFISEAVFAYEFEGKYYLPIAEFSQNLDFHVEIGKLIADHLGDGDDLVVLKAKVKGTPCKFLGVHAQ